MLTIRRAEPRDAGALGTLGATLMRTHHAFDPQRFLAAGDPGDSRPAWRAHRPLFA